MGVRVRAQSLKASWVRWSQQRATLDLRGRADPRPRLEGTAMRTVWTCPDTQPHYEHQVAH